MQAITQGWLEQYQVESYKYNYTKVTMQIVSSMISLVFFPPLERYCIVYVFKGSIMLILVWNGN